MRVAATSDMKRVVMTGDRPLRGKSNRNRPATPFPLSSAAKHLAAGRLSDAEGVCEWMLQIDTNQPDALNMLGMIAIQQGRHELAVGRLNRAAVAAPAFAPVHFNLGFALQTLGRDIEAVDAYRRTVALDPRHLHAQFNLGNALVALKRFDEAADAYEQVRAIDPTILETYNNLGNVLMELGRADAALRVYREAIALNPNGADTFTNLAAALLALGALPEALEATGQALNIDPSHAVAWFIRSELKTFKAGDGEIAQLEALVAAAKRPPRDAMDRINLKFALSKALMDAGEVDQAFSHLRAANQLQRAMFDYDVQADVRGLEALARVLDSTFVNRFADGGDQTDSPIFVLGMPRSGTSLVEQILASHPEVFGAGELEALEQALAATVGHDLSLEELAGGVAGMGVDDFRTISANYLGAVHVPAGAARFTDKMPGNFRFAGLIGLILPRARIVHCVRDPVDTCFSCYTKKFSGRQDFAYDLAELGTFYKAYDRLMSHWRALLPADRFIEVRYENLVDDIETEARRLVDFCGLAWNDACLDFHNTERPVRTASANQVRKPIYRSSVQRWRAYEHHLQPLIEAMMDR